MRAGLTSRGFRFSLLDRCPAAFSPALVLLPPILLLSACRGEVDTGDPDLFLDLAISPTPPAVGPGRLIISLTDSAGAPVAEAEVVVEGNMSHAGMVPVLDTAVAEEPGRYGISDFTFTMAGDWVLTVQATLPDGRRARIDRPTHVVGQIGGGL
jgi:hypothetical protein